MEKKNTKGEIIDFIKDLIIIWIIVLIIRTFLAEPFQISGQSMYASYYDKEFIIVDRFSYLDIPIIKESNINRWDVVVLKPGVSKEKEYYLKRIIGLGWETIKIKDWDVFLKKVWETEFSKLDEKYLNEENNWNTKIGNLKTEHIFKIPKWKFFVMWDNRNHSSDSRRCFSVSCSIWKPRDPFISKEHLVGKVLIDLGYFNFTEFDFIQPNLWIKTTPRWLSSPSTYNYE